MSWLPLRCKNCNELLATLNILKIIDGNYTGEYIAKIKPKLYNETKELLITLKRDKIIDI